jgi:XTP/dITP diphosphohydrolase
MTLLFATTNRNKVREVRHALRAMQDHPAPYQLLTLGDVDATAEPEETGTTYWENARIKALAYAHGSGLVTVAEDSGFEVDALGGTPGVQSARFLGAATSYPERFAEIYRRLAAQPSPARFVTALAVARGPDLLFETESVIEGEVAAAPAGQNGFGYDPIFFYPPFGGTTAQLTEDQKAAVSHRARAFRDLHRWLRTRKIT